MVTLAQSDTSYDRPQILPVARSRREQVIDAAANIFARSGYHGAGMRAIADALGIKVASLYTYFRSKDEALEVVCRVGIEQPLIYLREAYDNVAGFEQRMSQFFSAHHRHLHDHCDYVSVFMNERRYLQPDATARLNAVAREMRGLFNMLFDDARAEGRLHSNMSNRMARLILIGMLRNITQFYLEGPIADFENFVQGSVEHFLRGIAPSLPNNSETQPISHIHNHK